MAEAPSLAFVMHGARTAIAGGLDHIDQQVRSLEQAVGDNPGLAFDLAKTLVESVCRTILTERSIAYNPGDDLPKLLKSATNNLLLLPIAASGESEVRKSLLMTLGGLHTAVQGICELRNQCGFATHGSDGQRPAMESAQALLAAEAADAIVGFLHRVHKPTSVASASLRLRYEDHLTFNEQIDQLHEPIKIFDEEFDPSRVLFEMAPEPYRLYLTGFLNEPDNGDEITTSDGQQDTIP